MKTTTRTVFGVAMSFFVMTVGAQARENVRVAGSSTVLPYSIIVAEEFGKAYGKVPIVESGGSSVGIKELCKGVGPTTIDIANSSRPMKPTEVKVCNDNGVTPVEVRFGYDGIVFAIDGKAKNWNLTPKDVYLALSRNSTAKTWSQVNANLPDWNIVAYIPGEKHGTREVFEEKVMAVGCAEVGDKARFEASGMSKKEVHQSCIRVRKDGGTVDIDGDYTETLARIEGNKTGVGVFGLSFYENNRDKLRVATMNGVVPSLKTISSGEYPVSRPLFFYVKKEHVGVVPGILDYVRFFISSRMIIDGPLVEYGLVPMSDDEHRKLIEDVNRALTK